ncbi:aminotransferase class I/II-fold pyridoxal phosphate-dependent enzyme [Roseateles sp. BYS180W]|uniref:Aminotransferase class I/II-fold pyridoxal phosphate-dependent enzyme n=1 Tax=Roseateles rivi TaxID=3299028 RepID=A0ABW7FX93_9BURK
MTLTEHGGPDALGRAPHDFSSNASCVPTPAWLSTALAQADRHHYPDPHYSALYRQLSHELGVAPERLSLCAGGAEGIRRLSLHALLRGVRRVWVPTPGFADYAAAARALGLAVSPYACVDEVVQACDPTHEPALLWLCEPCNPTGRGLSPEEAHALTALLRRHPRLQLCVDLAYAELRLHGSSHLPEALLQAAWVLRCPNKALATTGVRAAVLQAPQGQEADAAQLRALAASWVLGAEGVVLLHHAFGEAAQAHYRAQRHTLRLWQQAQHTALVQRGWVLQPSHSNFTLGRAAHDLTPRRTTLREHGVKLRCAASLGAPGWWRLSVQPPASQAALWRALDALEPLLAPQPILTP